MMSNIKALLFDLDGLLIDSERISRDIWNTTAAEFNRTIDEIYPRLIGTGMARTDEILAEYFGDADLVARMRVRKREIEADYLSQNAIPTKPGAVEILVTARSLGFKSALATGSVRASVDAKIRPHNIESHFDAFVCGDEVLRGKPAPDIFLEAAARLLVEPAECVVFEDSMAGVDAACAAGMRVVAIPDLVQFDTSYAERDGVVIVPSLFDAHRLVFGVLDAGGR
jgi:beta-phosphoglucomutase